MASPSPVDSSTSLPRGEIFSNTSNAIASGSGSTLAPIRQLPHFSATPYIEESTFVNSFGTTSRNPYDPSPSTSFDHYSVPTSSSSSTPRPLSSGPDYSNAVWNSNEIRGESSGQQYTPSYGLLHTLLASSQPPASASPPPSLASAAGFLKAAAAHRQRGIAKANYEQAVRENRVRPISRGLVDALYQASRPKPKLSSAGRQAEGLLDPNHPLNSFPIGRSNAQDMGFGRIMPAPRKIIEYPPWVPKFPTATLPIVVPKVASPIPDIELVDSLAGPKKKKKKKRSDKPYEIDSHSDLTTIPVGEESINVDGESGVVREKKEKKKKAKVVDTVQTGIDEEMEEVVNSVDDLPAPAPVAVDPAPDTTLAPVASGSAPKEGDPAYQEAASIRKILKGLSIGKKDRGTKASRSAARKATRRRIALTNSKAPIYDEFTTLPSTSIAPPAPPVVPQASSSRLSPQVVSLLDVSAPASSTRPSTSAQPPNKENLLDQRIFGTEFDFTLDDVYSYHTSTTLDTPISDYICGICKNGLSPLPEIIPASTKSIRWNHERDPHHLESVVGNPAVRKHFRSCGKRMGKTALKEVLRLMTRGEMMSSEGMSLKGEMRGEKLVSKSKSKGKETEKEKEKAPVKPKEKKKKKDAVVVVQEVEEEVEQEDSRPGRKSRRATKTTEYLDLDSDDSEFLLPEEDTTEIEAPLQAKVVISSVSKKANFGATIVPPKRGRPKGSTVVPPPSVPSIESLVEPSAPMTILPTRAYEKQKRSTENIYAIPIKKRDRTTSTSIAKREAAAAKLLAELEGIESEDDAAGSSNGANGSVTTLDEGEKDGARKRARKAVPGGKVRKIIVISKGQKIVKKSTRVKVVEPSTSLINFQVIIHSNPTALFSITHRTSLDSPISILRPLETDHSTTPSSQISIHSFVLPTNVKVPVDGLLTVRYLTQSGRAREQNVLLALGKGDLRLIIGLEEEARFDWSVEGGSMRLIGRKEMYV